MTIKTRHRRTRSFYAASPSPAPRTVLYSGKRLPVSQQRASLKPRIRKAHASAKPRPCAPQETLPRRQSGAYKQIKKRRLDRAMRWFPCFSPTVVPSPPMRQKDIFLMLARRVTGPDYTGALDADQTLLSLCAALSRLSKEHAADSSAGSFGTIELARMVAALARTSVHEADQRFDMRTVPFNPEPDVEMLDEVSYREAIQRLSVQLRELEQVSAEVLGSPPMVTFRSLPIDLRPPPPRLDLRRTRSLPALPDILDDSLEEAVERWAQTLTQSPVSVEKPAVGIAFERSCMRSTHLRQSVLDPILEEDLPCDSPPSPPPNLVKSVAVAVDGPAARMETGLATLEDALIPLNRLISYRQLETKCNKPNLKAGRPTLKTPSRVAIAERARRRRARRFEAAEAEKKERILDGSLVESETVAKAIDGTRPLQMSKPRLLTSARLDDDLPPLPMSPGTPRVPQKRLASFEHDCVPQTVLPSSSVRSLHDSSSIQLRSPPLLASTWNRSTLSHCTPTKSIDCARSEKRRRRQGVFLDTAAFQPLQLAFLGSIGRDSRQPSVVF
ncbi:hypothetical protein BCR37DRAFT_376160 [Protomyces lactucae-debilis]|uniref:Uncharacterized protein n=1 Tax=Protomyces lactucae-debilis TaxID=2754530 RepID=A0A1Y2FS92_PROLT|nr:uncharacterized protein BCR37DRAFT_376160 [Protomyces lactucae-debilis]ORY86880.1 hypothetical protein BCR37DRAFT_376160 [Protomyces lactucae-debilis]